MRKKWWKLYRKEKSLRGMKEVPNVKGRRGTEQGKKRKQ
jgi:hypothetical protein